MSSQQKGESSISKKALLIVLKVLKTWTRTVCLAYFKKTKTANCRLILVSILHAKWSKIWNTLHLWTAINLELPLYCKFRPWIQTSLFPKPPHPSSPATADTALPSPLHCDGVSRCATQTHGGKSQQLNVSIKQNTWNMLMRGFQSNTPLCNNYLIPLL